ncbi:MAG: exopolysaccharide biosynthesis protein, partial [Terrimicrobiaceae bacterium]
MHELVRTADASEKISDALRRLLREANGRPLMIREMVEILHGRGLQFVVILLCLPFLAPVTIPGVSIPFGLAIALCGLRIAFGHKPW